AVDEIVGVSFAADTQFGWTPLSVNFAASSALTVDTWSWSFGDGDSAYVQSPSHVYADAGMYTVAVEIDAAGDIRQASKDSYIIALADTIKTDSTETHPGEDVEVVIYANNTIPVSQYKVPIEYGGTLLLTIDSVSTVGCLTDNFDTKTFLNYDSFNKRFTYQMTAGSAPQVQPTSGPILKVYFSVNPTAIIGQNATIITDGYGSYTPHVVSPFGEYDLAAANQEVYIGGCCINIRGNADGDINDEINIADLVFMVDYSFGSPQGPEPTCIEEADVDASNELNIADIVYLVDYSFGAPAGPAPLSCF
ncbi:MAG: PKD domain-containing protein, partial [Calditrichaeota bacterium]